jgi:hypothetical protein
VATSATISLTQWHEYSERTCGPCLVSASKAARKKKTAACKHSCHTTPQQQQQCQSTDVRVLTSRHTAVWTPTTE